MIILAALSALALLAGIAVARRLFPESRTESALCTGLSAITIVLVAINALGWTHTLTPIALGALVAALSIASVIVATEGPLAQRASELLCHLRALAALPRDAALECWRARSPAGLLLAAALALLGWTLWLAYLAPSGAWDGLWYHEPMVALALQNRGFALENVPRNLDWVNGYPRTSENLMLWLTVFSGRELIDGVPSFMGLLSMIAMVAMCRRAGRGWRTGAMGMAAVLVTIPGAILQMRSTYVDVTVLAAYLCALHYVTAERFGAREVLCASMGIAFLGGTKATGLVFGGVLGTVLLLRALRAVARPGAARAWAAGLFGLALIALLVAPTYVRNIELHGNPFWPIRIESRLLGTLEGSWDLGNMQWPADQVVHELWGHPTPGEDYHDTRRHAFGYAITFVALPMLLLAFVALLARVRSHVRAIALDARWSLLQLALGALPLVVSPAYYWARYSLPTPAVALSTIHAWLARTRSRSIGEAAIATMGVLNLLQLFWAAPGWDVTIATAIELMSLAPEERAYVVTSHNLMPSETTRLREERIGPGDVVAYDDEVAFVGNLWNEDMSNRVLYVPYESASAYLEALRAAQVEWVVVRAGSLEARALERSEAYVRLANAQRDDLVFERRPP